MDFRDQRQANLYLSPCVWTFCLIEDCDFCLIEDRGIVGSPSIGTTTSLTALVGIRTNRSLDLICCEFVSLIMPPRRVRGCRQLVESDVLNEPDP